MWECYLDGCKVREFNTEDEAIIWCEMYDGDKEPSYEYAGDSEPETPISDCGPF